MAYQLTLPGNLNSLEHHGLTYPVLWFVKTGHQACTLFKRQSVLLSTSPNSIVYLVTVLLFVVATETAINQEDQEPDIGPQLGLTFPEGTTAKQTIPPYPSREQPAKIHTPETCPVVRTCPMGKDMGWCWSPTNTVSGQTCTGFNPAAQWLQWPHGSAESDFPQIQAPFWHRKKKTHHKIHADVTRGIIKLSYTSGFQAAVLRTWGVSMDYC